MARRKREIFEVPLALLLIVFLAMGTGVLSLGCKGHHSNEIAMDTEEKSGDVAETVVVHHPVAPLPPLPAPESGFNMPKPVENSVSRMFKPDNERAAERGRSRKMTHSGYNIPDFAHLSAVGCNRGHGHDKQPLGVQLKAGGTFRVKQTNAAFGKNVIVEFLHYASGTGPTLSVPSNGDIVSWTNETGRVVVPVLRGQTAPENGATPALEFDRTEEMIDLTIWDHEKNYPGGAAQFYLDWEKNSLQTGDPETNDGYAMILSPRINFLIHVFDREDMSHSPLFNDAGLAKWLNYYNDLINHFDELLGLDDSKPWNKKTDIRYFCKPHQAGAGAAYYTNTHIAMSRKSLRQRTGPINTGFFLIGWWGGSHEIAHGYEGDARSTLPHSATFSGTAEVWNNFYTIMTWDAPAIKNHYLPNGYGTRFDDAERFMARVKEVGFPGLGTGNVAGKSDYDRKLYFFVSLYESLGDKFFTHYNQEIRRMAYEEKREPGSPSRFAKYFGARDKANLIPYFEYWGLEIDQETRDYARQQDYKGMAVIDSVVTNPATQQSLIREYGLKSKFNLLSNERLRTNVATRDLVGNATVNIVIDDLNELRGKKWHLMDGNQTVREGTFRGNPINISRVHLGAYTLRMPDTNNAYLIDVDNATILIKQDSTTPDEVKYEKATNPFASHQRVVTLGDYTLFTFDLRPDRVNISGPPNRRVTRSGGSGKYISIEVLDATGQQQHVREWLRNTQYSPESIEWKMQEGWQVKIYHLEPSSVTRDNRRRSISNGFTGASEDDDTSIQKMQTVTFTVNNGEVVLEGLTEQQRVDVLKKQIDVYAKGLLAAPNRTASAYLHAGIESLPEPARTEYLQKYEALVGNKERVH